MSLRLSKCFLKPELSSLPTTPIPSQGRKLNQSARQVFSKSLSTITYLLASLQVITNYSSMYLGEAMKLTVLDFSITLRSPCETNTRFAFFFFPHVSTCHHWISQNNLEALFHQPVAFSLRGQGVRGRVVFYFRIKFNRLNPFLSIILLIFSNIFQGNILSFYLQTRSFRC